MATTRPKATVRPTAKRSPRRLSRDARREQLVGVAMSIVAHQGLVNFSLDEMAARADVTRNLLYHYFPRGRPDILVAVAERAGEELTGGWAMDDSVPLPERMAANFSHFIEHATEPTDAWLIHRQGRASNDPALQEIIDRFERVVITSVSLNNFGTPDPPPLARLAIKGFIAFSESVLDEARVPGAPPPQQVLQLVAQTFQASLQAAAAAAG